MGQDCRFHFEGLGLKAHHGVAIGKPLSSCGDAEAFALADFDAEHFTSQPFADETSEDHAFPVFAPGTAFDGTPGLYGICWSATPGDDLALYKIKMGELYMKGPIAGDFKCHFGTSCVVEVSGFQLETTDSAVILSLASSQSSTCGESDDKAVMGFNPAPAREIPAEDNFERFNFGVITTTDPRPTPSKEYKPRG